MMVHSWHTQHIKISFKDKDTNQTHYINPRAWSTRRRWSSHADMIHQYGKCIQERLKNNNFTNIELHMDIWRSMNHRFHQRQIDPKVDLTQAKWSPFEETRWLMPLLTNLSDWRTKMKDIEIKMGKIDRNLDITFVADFPGLMLENYISNDLNATIEVLNGQINVEINAQNYTLSVGDKMKACMVTLKT
jgi:vitamin K-dependent gamma-carboxylase